MSNFCFTHFVLADYFHFSLLALSPMFFILVKIVHRVLIKFFIFIKKLLLLPIFWYFKVKLQFYCFYPKCCSRSTCFDPYVLIRTNFLFSISRMSYRSSSTRVLIQRNVINYNDALVKPLCARKIYMYCA